MVVEGVPQVSPEVVGEINQFVLGARQLHELSGQSHSRMQRDMSDGTKVQYSNNQGAETVRVLTPPEPAPPEPQTPPTPPVRRAPRGAVTLAIDLIVRGTSYQHSSVLFLGGFSEGYQVWPGFGPAVISEATIRPGTAAAQYAASSPNASGAWEGQNEARDIRFAETLLAAQRWWEAPPSDGSSSALMFAVLIPEAEALVGGDWEAEPNFVSYLARPALEGATTIDLGWVQHRVFQTFDQIQEVAVTTDEWVTTAQEIGVRVRMYATDDENDLPELGVVLGDNEGGIISFSSSSGWGPPDLGTVAAERVAVSSEWRGTNSPNPYDPSSPGMGELLAETGWVEITAENPSWLDPDLQQTDYHWAGPGQIAPLVRIIYEAGTASITVL